MAASNRTDTDRASAHKISLAATLCAFIIAATLLLSSAIRNHRAPIEEDDYRFLRIQRHHQQHDAIAIKTAMLQGNNDESHPSSPILKITSNRIVPERKTRRLQESSPTTLLKCHNQPNNDNNDNNDGRPKPKLPSLPNLLSTSTYAASFPGSGNKLLTKHLVESISGMLVGDASASPSLERMKVQKMDRTGFARGQMEVIALRTYYPHPDVTEGNNLLSAWDDYLTRAFVVLRNPMYAIPVYFDGMYQMKTHNLPSSASSSSSNNNNDKNNDNSNSEEMDEDTALWIKWRDDQFSIQLQHYKNFVSYWMERYAGHDDRRVFFSYEGLISEDTGVIETMRLASFLEGGIRANVVDMVLKGTEEKDSIAIAIDDSIYAEALESFANVEEVPCMWEDIVRATVLLSSSSLDGGEASSSATTTRGLSGILEVSQQPTEGRRRPFTPENLAEMSKLLLEMMDEWNEHQRLFSILSGYQREVTDNLKAMLYP
mmetsp:Transcript_34342/g.63145  ORF Transcript_34342/g.63145 Transcript_34342/m.63145 type:complete len:487 (-) Transcript_34342:81-1541(-)